ncbi:Serine/threonine-protein kinase WNK1 [Schistosoma japonicum]|nr:Serine/threonine-protein kinase WNK1 [Schistosoma japonicum]
MNAPLQPLVPKSDNITDSSVADADTTEAHVSKTEDNDLLNRSAFRRDSGSRSATKKVKIVDPKQTIEADSDDEDLLSQSNTTGVPTIGESIGTVNCSQSNDQQSASIASTDRKKTKEERKKEREKKKEEEMLKKYQAEQEAKQKISAKSKCSRWIKHNLKIGEGGYKFVYRGYDSVEARNVAWCEFKREHVDTKEKRQAMFRETEIMLKMNHPHIVRCFDVFREWIDMEDPNNQIEEKGVVIIQELMGEGTLKSVIRKNFLDGQCILKFPLITRWWHQILDALRYMHHKIQPPILHRDLKADNCFLYGASDEEYLNVKVGDFGLATHVSNSGRKTMLGTLGFMAPEIFDEKYDEKVDIYAFGMLMLEVMTNRTPYDECETVLQVAAKTMSGQGPDIMQMVSNPSLREVISACIQPLTCFRPTADELYFHPLFQPKTLPVEVEPNYDNATDRAEVLDRFVRSLGNPETRNPNFNLRLRFRDKKMLQELGLDDGESLEFDLDIYKAEDQDIPDLIHNLRLGYEDKLWRVFENPKQPDKKIVSNHLDKLFSSIRLQMQFLVKVLLGKRWKAILDSLVQDQPVRKKQDGASAVDEDDESDTDAYDTSSFTIIGKYKSKWNRAKKLLEKEIHAYRNSTTTASSTTSSNVTCNTITTTVNTSASSVTFTTPSSGVAVPQAQVDALHISGSTNIFGVSGQVSVVSQSKMVSEPIDSHSSNVDNFHQGSSTGAGSTSIGKFTVTIPPSATAAPVTPNTYMSLSASASAPTPTSTPVSPQDIGIVKSSEIPVSSCSNNSSIQYTAPVSLQTDMNLTASRPASDQNNAANTTNVSSQASTGSLTGCVSTQQTFNQKPPQPFQSQQSTPCVNTSQNQPSVFVPVLSSLLKSDVDSTPSNNLDTIARSAMILQQVLQGITSTSITNSTVSTAESLLGSQAEGANQNHLMNSCFTPPILNDNLSSTLLVQHSTSTQHNHQMQSQAGTLNMNDNISTGLQLIPSGSTFQRVVFCIVVYALCRVCYYYENFAQSETDNFQKIDQSHPMVNAEHASLISQLTEVIMNNAAQGLLLGGNNYLSSMNPSYNTEQLQQPILNNQVAQLNCASRQISTQQNQLENVASIAKPTERRTRKKSKSKPRYILRVTKIERDSESCEPGNLRPTFYLEMPDMNNPNNELWKITFRCNLSDTLEDIKLFQGSGYTPANKDIDHAAKDAVMHLLEALRNDVHSVKLNHDYIFYPRPSTVGFDQANRPASSQSVTSVFQPLNSNFANQFNSDAFQNTPSVGLPYTSTGFYDNLGFVSNLEEIQPLDSKNQDDDEEFSENSRPLSPVDSMNQPTNSSFQTAVSNIEPITSSMGNTNTHCMVNYTTSSNAERLLNYDSVVNNSKSRSEISQITGNVLTPDFSNTNLVSQPLLPMNLNQMNDILSSSVGRLENGGVNLFNCQSGLEEVPPLVPCLTEQSSNAFVGNAGSVSCNEPSSRDPTVISQSENVAYQLYGTHPLHNVLNWSNVSSWNPSGFGYNSSVSFTPEELVNVTFTIPSYLETTLRTLVSNMCLNPSHACVLIPTIESSEVSSFYRCFGVRVIDIPEGHMFVGIPEDRRVTPGTCLRSTLLTAVESNSEKLFVLTSGTNSADSFSGPHIYKLPQDSALILTHTGNIHSLDKAALVVPVRSVDHSYSFSPPGSPIHEPGTNSTVSSVYVRELPIPADVDALSFDDVLALLLALRDAPHGTTQSYHSSTVNTSNDVENIPTGSKTAAFDTNPGTESLSRRSSAATTILPAAPNYYSTHIQAVPTSGVNPSQPSQSSVSQQVHQQVQNSLQSGLHASSLFSIPVSISQQPGNQIPSTVCSNVINPRLSLSNQVQSPIQSVNQPFSLQLFPHSAMNSSSGYSNQTNMPIDSIQSAQSIIAQNQLSLPLSNVSSQQQSFPVKLLQEQILVSNQTPSSSSCLSGSQPQSQQLQQQQPALYPQQHSQTQSATTQSKESQQQTAMQPNTQQLIQLLSALNTLQNLDQVPQLLSNLLKTTNQMTNVASKSSTSSGVIGTAPTVGVIRHSRQVSPPVSTQSSTPSSTQSQANQLGQRFSAVSSSVPNVGVCSSSVNTLPALLSRLLSSAAVNSEWLAFNEPNKPQGIQLHPSLVQTNLSSTVENQEGLNVQSVIKTPTISGGGIPTPQLSQHSVQPQQPLIQIPPHQQPTQIHSQLQHSQITTQQPSQMQLHMHQSHISIPSTQTQSPQQPPQMSGQIQQLTQLQPQLQPTQMQQQLLPQMSSIQMQQHQPSTINPQVQTHQMHQQQSSQIPVLQQGPQSQTVYSSQQQSLQSQTHQPHISQPVFAHHQFQHTSQQSQWQQPQHALNVMPKLSAPLPVKERNQQQLSLPAAHSYLSQILPELANAVRLLQQTPDNNNAGLPIDVQNKLITLLQQSQQYSGTQQQLQQQQVKHQPHQLSSAQELGFSCTVTNVSLPTCVSVNNQVLNIHSSSSSSKLPIPSHPNFTTVNRFIVSPCSVSSSNTSIANPTCTTVPSSSARDHAVDVTNVEYPHASLPTEQPSITSARPVNTSAKTVANKFTVAPANMDEDDPGYLPAIQQIPGSNQQHQVPPPRPPRQQRPYGGQTVGVHPTNEPLGLAPIGVTGANVSMISNMNQVTPIGGAAANANLMPNMNQPALIGTATNVNSSSVGPLANKIDNVPQQSIPSSTVTIPTTTLTATLPRTQIPPPHHQSSK